MELDALFTHTGWVRALSVDLLGDAEQADDVVQETFLSALRQPSGRDWSTGSMRAWLASVARNFARMSMRAESRRRRREQWHAVAEAQPPASESLERIELQRRIASAVMALGSPDREIVALRYFDELPPREIARRLGLTPNAVSTRLSRARAALRVELEEEYRSSGASWSVVALAWTRSSEPLAWSIVIGGIAVKKAVALVTVSLVLFAFWFGSHVWNPRVDHASVQEVAPGQLAAPVEWGGDEAAQLISAGGAATARIAQDVAPTNERAEAPETTAFAPGMGRVRVCVRDGTGEPVPGVGLMLHPWGRSQTWFHQQRKTTDLDGTAVFTTASGAVGVNVERITRPNTFGAEGAEVVAGETSEVEFELIGGQTIRGRVVDWAGRSIAGADVWLSDGMSLPYLGQVVARSAADGSFELEHVSYTQGIAARAVGYLPSRAIVPAMVAGRPLADGESVDVELVLRDVGGEVEGTLEDAAGRPLANALVVVGNAEFGRRERVDGVPSCDPPPFRVRTDLTGAFRVEGTEIGRVRVRARTLGFDIAESSVDVPRGGAGTVHLVAQAAGRVEGVVWHADGRPAADASVELDDGYDRLTRTSTRTDDAGAFELDGLPVGRVRLLASLADDKLETRIELETRPGLSEWWDATLPAPLALTGRLLTTDDVPLAGWLVLCEPEHDETGATMTQHVRTDANGAFRLEGGAEAVWTLRAQPPGQWTGSGVARLEHVRPQQSPITLRVAADAVPTAAMHGKVVDSRGRAVADAEIHVESSHPQYVSRKERSDADGTFHIEYLSAANYTIRISASDFEPLELRDLPTLDRDEQRELGDLMLAASDGERSEN